jgi:hypothetical protein
MRRTKTRSALSANLIVFAGMPRTGSTSLFHILGQHPAVFRPFRKEMGYFLFNQHKGEDWYLHAYADARADQRCVDITPEYFFDPAVVERIDDFGDDVRVVIGVRDPASFAASLHHEYGKRYAVPPLQSFIDHFSYARGSGSIDFSLRSGTIRKMLDLYCRTFGDRVLLYDFAAFSANPLSLLQPLERFMGIPPFFTPETFQNVVMNTSERPTTKWFSAIVSAEPLIDAATRILPAAALRRLAAIVYRGAKKPAGQATQTAGPLPPVPPGIFEDDRQFIDALFGGKTVINGRGESLQSS